MSIFLPVIGDGISRQLVNHAVINHQLHADHAPPSTNDFFPVSVNGKDWVWFEFEDNMLVAITIYGINSKVLIESWLNDQGAELDYTPEEDEEDFDEE